MDDNYEFITNKQDWIDGIPPIEPTVITRCRYCEYWQRDAPYDGEFVDGSHGCRFNGGAWYPDDFCSLGHPIH